MGGPRMSPTPDLLIVGGGPAGLATAIRARQEGFQVELLDRGRPPIDKACGEGLMPDAVARLQELGVELAERESAKIRGIRYLDGDLVAEAEFPLGHGLGLRRLELHRALLERASALGLQPRWEEKVLALHDDGVETARGRLRARWVIGADGLGSPLRRWAGLDGPAAKLRRFGVRRHFDIAPWSPYVEVYWGERCEAYITPVSQREIGVALLWSGEKSGFDGLLERFPALLNRLKGASATSRDRGCGPLHRRARAVHRGCLALVGDAAGYLDAITGEGLALAFHQAFALVEALKVEDLGQYGRAHRRIGRLPNLITGSVLWLERRPRFRRRLLRTLKADPLLFQRLLGIHARTLPPTQLGLSGVWRLAKGLAGGVS